MSPVAELQHAVDESKHPLVSLREKVQSVMQEEGLTSDEMLAVLRQLRAHYRAAGDSRSEDVVLDAMDFVAGWCSTHMKIRRVA